mgnify:CR=1 FL=1
MVGAGLGSCLGELGGSSRGLHCSDADDALADDAPAEDIQSAVYATGKAAGYENLRDWFQCLYQVLLGQSEGPRMGSFFALYGREKTRLLLTDALAGKLADKVGAEG